MRRLGFMLCAVALPWLVSAARAADIEIIQPWVRVNPGPGTGAVYFTLHNGGAAPDRLVSAATPMAARSEVHSSVEQGNVVRMEKIERVEVSAGGSVPFQPGGLHVMLTGIVPGAAPGGMMPITLRFERAGEVKISAPILSPGAAPPSPAAMGPHGVQGGGADRHGPHGSH